MKKKWLVIASAVLLVILAAGVGCKKSGISIEGTRWLYHDEEGMYDIEFEKNGKLVDHDPWNTTPDNDRWDQDGYTVHIYFNDSYATLTGTLNEDATILSGTAVNIVNTTWTWRASRY